MRGCEGARVQGAGCRVQGAGCRVPAVGAMPRAAGSRVQGSASAGVRSSQSSSSAPALGMKRAMAASGRCAESWATSRKRAPVSAASQRATWRGCG